MFQQHPRVLVIISLILLCITIYISFVKGTPPTLFKENFRRFPPGGGRN